MPNTLQFRRGIVANLPSLSAGEPALTTDQFRIYAGSAGGNRLLSVLHKINGTTAPGVNDDSAAGYSPGSRWIDTTNSRSYVCISAGVGAAVWQQTSGTGSGGITQLTGDATAGPGSGSQALTLAASGVSPGSYGSATAVPVLTFDAKGRCTGATTASIATGTVPRGHIDGLTLAYNSTTLLSIATGQCADSTAAKLLSLTAFTKTLQSSGSWTAGSGNNGLDTGARAANTWYHVFVISDSTGATVDVLFSLSATSPTLPSGYTLFRRVGSVLTNASALFSDWWKQIGDTFLWSPRWSDVSALNPGTSAVTRTLTVPTGVKVCAILGVGFDASATADNAAAVLLSSLDVADTAPAVDAYTYIAFSSSVLISNAGGQAQIWTNTSGQIRSRLQVSATNTRLRIHTYGWIDQRGRDA